MDQDLSLKAVIEILKQEGMTEDQIGQSIEAVVGEVNKKFSMEAISVLSEDDLKAIDAATSQEEADTEIKLRFQAKTGKNPEEVLRELYIEFAKGFMEQHQKEHAAGNIMAPQPTTPS